MCVGLRKRPGSCESSDSDVFSAERWPPVSALCPHQRTEFGYVFTLKISSPLNQYSIYQKLTRLKLSKECCTAFHFPPASSPPACVDPFFHFVFILYFCILFVILFLWNWFNYFSFQQSLLLKASFQVLLSHFPHFPHCISISSLACVLIFSSLICINYFLCLSSSLHLSSPHLPFICLFIYHFSVSPFLNLIFHCLQLYNHTFLFVLASYHRVHISSTLLQSPSIHSSHFSL